MRVDVELSICADCMIWHANGDDSGIDESRDAGTHATQVRTCAGLTLAQSAHVVVIGDELGFCRSACDTCDDHSHGDRFSAAVLA